MSYIVVGAVCLLVGFVAGMLVYRKHSAKLTALLHETEDNAAKLKAEAEEWRAKFKALKG